MENKSPENEKERLIRIRRCFLLSGKEAGFRKSLANRLDAWVRSAKTEWTRSLKIE
jgi:hypothetical protein